MDSGMLHDIEHGVGGGRGQGKHGVLEVRVTPSSTAVQRDNEAALISESGDKPRCVSHSLSDKRAQLPTDI